MTTKTKVKIVLSTVLIIAIGYCVWAGAKAIALPGKVSAAALPFDHSQCQYPDRTTNPPNGCDNSDPCDPAQTKGGSGDCLPTEKDPNDLPDPNRPYYDGQGNKYDYMGNLIEAAPQEEAPAPASSCSGK